MRRALPTALAGVGAVGLAAGMAGWVLALVLPGRGPGSAGALQFAGGWPLLDTGLPLAAACVAVVGAAVLTGVACDRLGRSRGPLPTGRARWLVAAAAAAVAAGVLVLAVAPAAGPGLVYLSPEQYSTLVVALRVQRAGELAAAAGLVLLAGALGRLVPDRSR